MTSDRKGLDRLAATAHAKVRDTLKSLHERPTSDRDTLREAVARIVVSDTTDADAFRTLDEWQIARRKASIFAGPCVTAQEVFDRYAPSRAGALSKADAILAIIPLSEVEEVLEPFGAIAGHYRHDQPDVFIPLQRSAFSGRDDWTVCLAVSDLRKARALLSKLKAIRGEPA